MELDVRNRHVESAYFGSSATSCHKNWEVIKLTRHVDNYILDLLEYERPALYLRHQICGHIWMTLQRIKDKNEVAVIYVDARINVGGIVTFLRHGVDLGESLFFTDLASRHGAIKGRR